MSDETMWVERVGRILFRQARGVSCPPFSQNWRDYETDAREIIDSLRAPTEGMIDALQSYAVCAGNIEEGWDAAIDVALKGL
jgi:hypothetical protein